MPRNKLTYLVAKIRPLQASQSADLVRERLLWKQFSDAVREARIRKGWSLEDLGERIGTGRSMCSYLETGHRGWDLALAVRAAKELS